MTRTAVPQLVDGVIDEFIQAKHVWPRSIESIKHFGLHTPEGPEMPKFARNLGRYFATTDRVASTHFGTDNELTVRYASDDQTCASAKGVNTSGIHVEIAGVAAQTAEQWNDEFSVAALKRTANLFHLYHEAYDIPAVMLTVPELVAGKPGIVKHSTAWQAFGGDFRSDPGDNFPDELFLAMCRGEEDTDMRPFEDIANGWRAFNQDEEWAIRLTQEMLRAAGYRPGAPDGKKRPMLFDALEEFGAGDDPTKIGPPAWRRLVAAAVEFRCPEVPRQTGSQVIDDLTAENADLKRKLEVSHALNVEQARRISAGIDALGGAVRA